MVSGEQRFERERTEGRYRMFQCAYRSFRRAVPLPVPVSAASKAIYNAGVLKIEPTRPKPAKRHVWMIKVVAPISNRLSSRGWQAQAVYLPRPSEMRRHAGDSAARFGVRH